ncbi:MAG: haloacid dehalogenase-like hydrolase [Alphaproteobacteria bacterium]|nr:haloacid dehalogenase-like hydrolase [Alphaproteobacteria bacterium]
MKNKCINIIIYDWDGTCVPRYDWGQSWNTILKNENLFKMLFWFFLLFLAFTLYKLKLISVKTRWHLSTRWLNKERLKIYSIKPRERPLFDWVKESVAEDKKIADLVICLTESPQPLMVGFKERVGFDRIIGTPVCPEKFWKIQGQPLKKNEKFSLLFKEYGHDINIIKVYTDSENDFPLCKIAEKSVFVNHKNGKRFYFSNKQAQPFFNKNIKLKQLFES